MTKQLENMEVNSVSSLLNRTKGYEEAAAEVDFYEESSCQIVKEMDSRILSEIHNHMLKSSDKEHGLIVWYKPDKMRTWHPEPLHLREIVEYFENNSSYESSGHHPFDLMSLSEECQFNIINSRIKRGVVLEEDDDDTETKHLNLDGMRQVCSHYLGNWLDEIAARKIAVEKKQMKAVKYVIEEKMAEIIKASNEIMIDMLSGRVHATNTSGKFFYTIALLRITFLLLVVMLLQFTATLQIFN